MNFEISISAGELIDRLTITEIKIKKIKTGKKLSSLRKEFKKLKSDYEYLIRLYGENIRNFKKDLYAVNLKLWNTENRIRKHEAMKKFNEEFISLAREVYRNNDLRSALKSEINKLTGSESEIKQYSKY